MMASQKGQVESVKLLLDRGAEINMQNKVTGKCSMYPDSTVVDDVAREPCFFLSVNLFNQRFWKMYRIFYN